MIHFLICLRHYLRTKSMAYKIGWNVVENFATENRTSTCLKIEFCFHKQLLLIYVLNLVSKSPWRKYLIPWWLFKRSETSRTFENVKPPPPPNKGGWCKRGMLDDVLFLTHQQSLNALLVSSPELKAQVSFSDRLFSVVRPSVHLLTFHIFIFSRTGHLEFQPSWNKASLGKGDSSLLKWRAMLFSKQRWLQNSENRLTKF